MTDSLEVGDVVEYLGKSWTVTEADNQDEYSFTTLECILSGHHHTAILNLQAVERLVKIIRKYSPQ